ncbi:hypothetical protein FJT64_016096 [Amphibalanus amphitrite]|uniref:Gustatory receptor n=1 Tax=Amphibalanus amphitrite TaxID=1232801 RepID=A0A6A4XBH5_AMPAM|nr:hypothetical protein FJT64_016096 [Amphibalanus amphitrite]
MAIRPRPRRCSLLWYSLLYVLLTVGCWVAVRDDVRRGLDAEKRGEHWVNATLASHFFGLTMALVWLALTLTFVIGSRRFDALLDELPQLLQERQALAASYGGGGSAAGRNLSLLWLKAVVIVTAIFISLCIEKVVSTDCAVPVTCATSLLKDAMKCFILTFSQLVPLKYMFTGVLLSDSLHTLNAALMAVAVEDPVTLPPHLERLQTRLSALLARLTSAMAADLVVPTLFGVLAEIQVVTALVHLVTARAGPVSVLFPAAQAVLVVLLLVAPCETCQRLLSGVSASRDHLLLLERRLGAGPARRTAAWMREAAARDLENFGDLGLFRLRRATLLSIVSATITYMIVMAQFLSSSGSPAADDAFEVS